MAEEGGGCERKKTGVVREMEPWGSSKHLITYPIGSVHLLAGIMMSFHRPGVEEGWRKAGGRVAVADSFLSPDVTPVMMTYVKADAAPAGWSRLAINVNDHFGYQRSRVASCVTAEIWTPSDPGSYWIEEH